MMDVRKIEDFASEMQIILKEMGYEAPVGNTILQMEIKNAIGEINRCRRFTPSNDVLYDIKYEDKILPLAIAGFLKTGAEGETSHSENNITRTYENGGKYPDSMLADIVPLAKFN